MITVVAALIKKDNKYLIAKRSSGDPNVLGKWEFPGGKVEEHETEKEAVEREIKEEFELEIEANEFIINNICQYPSKTVDLRLYECNYISGQIILNDHSEYKWVKLEELLDYDLAKADVILAEYVKERYKI